MSSGSERLARVPLPLHTPRLLLRLPTPADVPDLRRTLRDRRAARSVGASLHSTAERAHPERMVARTLREYRAGEHLSLSVILTSDDHCIGRVGLRGLDWQWRKVESLSYWIDPGHWGQGIATEAAWALCDSGFRHLRLRRISSQALEPNRASRAVLHKLGFRVEGRERQAVQVQGRSIDMMLFGLLHGELPRWAEVVPARQKRLRAPG